MYARNSFCAAVSRHSRHTWYAQRTQQSRNQWLIHTFIFGKNKVLRFSHDSDVQMVFTRGKLSSFIHNLRAVYFWSAAASALYVTPLAEVDLSVPTAADRKPICTSKLLEGQRLFMPDHHHHCLRMLRRLFAIVRIWIVDSEDCRARATSTDIFRCRRQLCVVSSVVLR